MSQHRTRKWSQEVTEHRDALDLQAGIFTMTDPRKIARCLKDSSEHSMRHKSDSFRAAMSMLNFYINRAGDNLSATQRGRLEAAKAELRTLFKRPERTVH